MPGDHDVRAIERTEQTVVWVDDCYDHECRQLGKQVERLVRRPAPAVVYKGSIREQLWRGTGRTVVQELQWVLVPVEQPLVFAVQLARATLRAELGVRVDTRVH